MNKPATVTENSVAGTQAITRAFNVLHLFRDRRAEIGVVAVAKELGLTLSTAHRLIRVLIAEGYLRQNTETERYYLGASAVQLGQAALQTLGLDAASQLLMELRDTTGESVNLGALSGLEARSRSVLIHSRRCASASGPVITSASTPPRSVRRSSPSTTTCSRPTCPTSRSGSHRQRRRSLLRSPCARTWTGSDLAAGARTTRNPCWGSVVWLRRSSTRTGSRTGVSHSKYRQSGCLTTGSRSWHH